MLSITIKLDRVRADGTRGLFVHIIAQRKHRAVSTGIFVRDNEWDGYQVINNKYKLLINKKLNEYRTKFDEYIIEHAGKIITVDEAKAYVMLVIRGQANEHTLNSFTSTICAELKQSGREGNAIAHTTAVKSLTKHFNGDIALSAINYNQLKGYVLAKQVEGISNTSIGAYLRSIRAIYNEAVRRGIIPDAEPFKRGLIPARSKTVKKAIPKLFIDLLEKERHKLDGTYKDAVNFVLLQFYFRGMDFVDLVRLTHASIINGNVNYIRYKNRNKEAVQQLCIKITAKAAAILKEYNNTKYVLPYCVDGITFTELANIRKSVYGYVNRVCKSLGINQRITSKVIRHTWITIADSVTDKYHLVKYAAGHAMGDITETYIKYNQAEIDELNDMVCGSSPLAIVNTNVG